MTRMWGLGLAVVLAGSLAACGDTPSDGGRTPTESPATPSSEPTAADPSTASDDPESFDAGPALTAEGARTGGPGFAWERAEDTVLTDTAGKALGHLPGWRIDRNASDRLASAVLTDPGGTSWSVTTLGLVPLTEPLPLAKAATLHVLDGRFEITDLSGDVRTTTPLDDPDDLWVSATGTTAGAIGVGGYDLEAGAPTESHPSCRIADRHEPDQPLLVCEDGGRLVPVGGGPDITADEGTSFGWVTVGTTGDEILATVHADQGPVAHVGSREAGTLEPVPGLSETSAVLFARGSGDVWLAAFGADAGLVELASDGSLRRLADIPGAVDAAVWTR